MIVLARFAIREAVRRRVFQVVALLTLGFLALYALGVWQAFKSAGDLGAGFDLDPETVVGATMFGLGMFGILFLGVVLAVFLTLGTIRGDAERGLLQPLLVRPVTRREVLLSRLLAAGAVSAAYVLAVYVLALVITGTVGDWWPPLAPAAQLMFAVVVITALSLAGSVVLAGTANGIAVFMVFGAGLISGLLGQIGDAFDAETLQTVASVAAHALPFEALYQSGLADLTQSTTGVDRFVLQLGPLGGAQEAGLGLWLYALAYIAAVMAAAQAAFRRTDL